MSNDFVKPSGRRDWSAIVAHYNALPVGHLLRLPHAPNITALRASVVRRGLVSRLDFKVYNRGNACCLKRLSTRPMTR